MSPNIGDIGTTDIVLSWPVHVIAVGILKSFIGGLLMTLVLVILVPMLCNEYILPDISEYVGDHSFLMLTSDMIVNLIMYLIIFAFMGLLGGTMIYRTCGLFGILGLLAAYYLLGDMNDALVPVLMLILSMIIMKIIQVKRKKKAKCKENA